jgi:hypothetical protein
MTCGNGRSSFNISYTSTKLRVYFPGKLVNACLLFWKVENITGGAYHVN